MHKEISFPGVRDPAGEREYQINNRGSSGIAGPIADFLREKAYPIFPGRRPFALATQSRNKAAPPL